MSRFAFLILALLLVSLSVVHPLAQEARTVVARLDAAAVPEGSYQKLSAWQKVRFSATALVNPRIAEEAAVVFAFDAEKIATNLSGNSAGEFRKLVSSGEVRFGEAVTSGWVVVKEGNTQKVLSQLEQCKKPCELPLKGAFLSARSAVAGVQPSAVLIAWDPGPVVTSEK